MSARIKPEVLNSLKNDRGLRMEVAYRLGITDQAVYKWTVKGSKRLLDYNVLDIISTWLKRPVADLVEEDAVVSVGAGEAREG